MYTMTSIIFLVETMIQFFRFDTREFFNVFSIAFEEENFSMKSKQRLIDILLLLMLENSCFNPTQVFFHDLSFSMNKFYN